MTASSVVSMISDVRIGRNLALYRGDVSQKDLAAKMRARGFKWSQATVWAVEKGDRPLRLAEAAELARVFEIDMDYLTLEEGAAYVDRALSDLDEAASALIQAADSYEQARRVVQGTFEDVTDKGDPVNDRQRTLVKNAAQTSALDLVRFVRDSEAR